MSKHLKRITKQKDAFKLELTHFYLFNLLAIYHNYLDINPFKDSNLLYKMERIDLKKKFKSYGSRIQAQVTHNCFELVPFKDKICLLVDPLKKF